MFWVSDFWVVPVAADAAFPFVHFLILVLFEKVWILINVCCWNCVFLKTKRLEAEACCGVRLVF